MQQTPLLNISCEHNSALVDAQQLHTLDSLKKSSTKFPIASAEQLLYSRIPSTLMKKWSGELLDEPLEQPFARDQTTASSHQEDWAKASAQNYSYNTAPAHTRRLRMLADLIWFEAERRAAEGASEVIVTDVGAGDLSLERLLRSQAASHPTVSLTFVVADINPTVVRLAALHNLADTSVEWNWHERSLQEVIAQTGGDILVFAEVLEHIPFVRANFMQSQLATTIAQFQSSVIGSVPNALMFAEIAGYLQGTVSPWQLEKALTNPSFDHISHFTYGSLGRGLEEAGYNAENILITSNAIYLNNDDEDLSYGGALQYPHLGHRLIFLAKAGKKI